MEKTYVAIDLKSFYASVECVERQLDPLNTNLVVADESRTEKTICLAVSPSLKSFGISGRARLFEVIQRVEQVNKERLQKAPKRQFAKKSYIYSELSDPACELDYIVATPQMAKYLAVSAKIYGIYLKYVSPEDIFAYSIDEVFIDATGYLGLYNVDGRGFAQMLILDVLKTTGITATAGVGTNMYLCKEVLFMFMNVAYLNNSTSTVVDNTKPLIVTSCGNYRVKNRSEVVTHRPKGRKDYQLLYIASGKGHFFIHGEEKTVSAGNIIIYLPDQPQEYVYYRADQTDVYWVHFTGNEVEEILKYYNINLKNNILYIGTSPDYQWLFGQMIQELQLCRPRYDELISLQLRNIFVLISRAIMSAKKFSSTSEKEVAFAMHYFRKNYNTEISIEEYSESRGLSNCWFIQCFKEITGSSPLQYILKLRISNAQNLLENTDYTITEIANMVGYTNSLYFSRLFHKYIGMSPKEYRKVKLKENLRE